MATLKLHYDGWLVLPTGLRQKLGLKSGDRIDAELVDGSLLLRSAANTRSPVPPAEEVNEAAGALPPTTLPLVDDVRTTARKTRRTPKRTGSGDTLPASAPNRRGPAPSVPPAPLLPAIPVVGVGPAKLLKKADLEAKAAPQEVVAPSANAAMRIRSDGGSQPVERRPFRNVEVRTLGPGRGLWQKPRFDPDTLSSIWVMACRDESPVLTAFSVAYRLRGITPEKVVELVKSRQELFRLGLPARIAATGRPGTSTTKRLRRVNRRGPTGSRRKAAPEPR